MATKFEINQGGLLELLNDAAARAFLTETAQRGATATEQAAPIGRYAPHYKDTIGSTPAEPSPEGAKATFFSSSPVWHIVEFGSVNNPPYAPLRRGALAIGVDFRDQGR